jgi:hypothetical protein
LGEHGAGRNSGSGKKREGSGSFLKKRTKKRLPVWNVPPADDWAPSGKSFLVLFFKKEPLSLLYLSI